MSSSWVSFTQYCLRRTNVSYNVCESLPLHSVQKFFFFLIIVKTHSWINRSISMKHILLCLVCKQLYSLLGHSRVGVVLKAQTSPKSLTLLIFLWKNFQFAKNWIVPKALHLKVVCHGSGVKYFIDSCNLEVWKAS